jgi:hypothetical protein
MYKSRRNLLVTGGIRKVGFWGFSSLDFFTCYIESYFPGVGEKSERIQSGDEEMLVRI